MVIPINYAGSVSATSNGQLAFFGPTTAINLSAANGNRVISASIVSAITWNTGSANPQTGICIQGGTYTAVTALGALAQQPTAQTSETRVIGAAGSIQIPTGATYTVGWCGRFQPNMVIMTNSQQGFIMVTIP
jgi:hypothetical protein